MMTWEAENATALFDPKKVVTYPNDKAPKSPPKLLIDPIHEICWLVSGPEMSGVCSEDNIGNAGEFQLID